MLNYKVMTKEEAMKERFDLLPDGIYQAVIEQSTDKISSAGNPMMELILSVYDSDGQSHTVKDYLVFTPKMMWKVIDCAESAGVIKDYESKKFCSDVIRGCDVSVTIGTEKGGLIPEDRLNGKSHGSCYPDKNKVIGYLVNKRESSNDEFKDDELPF